MPAIQRLMHRPFSAVRWAARITALLLIGFVALFIVGEGVPNPLGQPLAVIIEFVAMASILVGLALGWWRERLGAALVFAGLLTFCAVELIMNASLPGPAFALFAIPAALYLAAWWGNRRER